MNAIQKKLAAGKVVTMVNPDFQSPRLVEFLATFGFDVVFFDAERMSYDFERIEELTRAAHLAGIAAMARPWTNDPGLVTRYFDCGVDGIAIPHVEDAAGACKWVEVVRYARPKDHADKTVIIMTETPAAIGNIGEIAAVAGVDVINIGVHDVALALGHQGQPEHPAVEKLVDQGIARILKAGKHAALNVLEDWERRMPALHAKGVRWFNVRARTFLARGATRYAELLSAVTK